MTVSEHPRVRRLLDEIDDARAMIARTDDPTGEVAVVLDDLYRDVGRLIHEISRPPMETPSPEEPPGFTPLADLPSFDPLETNFESDGWYTEEVDGTSIPLFGDGELGGETVIPEADLETLEAAVAPDGEPQRLTLAKLRATTAGQIVLEPALTQFLELLALPEDLYAESCLPDEASRIGWGSTVLDARLGEADEMVQQAVLAMLSARAHHLSSRLEVDIGPRLALVRMRRFRQQQELEWVNGLLPGAGPEGATWADDAQAYWSLLRP